MRFLLVAVAVCGLCMQGCDEEEQVEMVDITTACEQITESFCEGAHLGFELGTNEAGETLCLIYDKCVESRDDLLLACITGATGNEMPIDDMYDCIMSFSSTYEMPAQACDSVPNDSFQETMAMLRLNRDCRN